MGRTNRPPRYDFRTSRLRELLGSDAAGPRQKRKRQAVGEADKTPYAPQTERSTKRSPAGNGSRRRRKIEGNGQFSGDQQARRKGAMDRRLLTILMAVALYGSLAVLPKYLPTGKPVTSRFSRT